MSRRGASVKWTSALSDSLALLASGVSVGCGGGLVEDPPSCRVAAACEPIVVCD